VQEPRGDDRSVQGVRREARLPLLFRRGLCARGGRGGASADGRRCGTYLSGRTAQGGRRVEDSGRRHLHLYGLRRAGDATGGAWYSGPGVETMSRIPDFSAVDFTTVSPPAPSG